MSDGALPILFFTLRVAAASTLIILIPGILIAWALSRRGWVGRSLLETLVTLPLVIPPTAVGLFLLVLLGQGSPVGSWLQQRLGWDIAFTWRGVVLACAVIAFPLLVRSVRGSLEELDPRLSGMARTLGRGPLRVFLEVELPLAWRGVLAGSLLAFTRSLGEFGATVLVAGNIPGRTQTLALALFQQVQVGNETAALRMAGISVLLAFVVLLMVDRLTRRRESRLEQ